MNGICIISPAFTNFDRFGFAVVAGEMEGQAPLDWKQCRYKQKSISPEIPLASTIKLLPTSWGFFVSAVTTTIDSLLESAGCGEKTGWCMPLTASLAALGKRLHNCTTPKRQNGLYMDKLPRSAHLVCLYIQSRSSREAKSIHRLFAPLRNCSRMEGDNFEPHE